MTDDTKPGGKVIPFRRVIDEPQPTYEDLVRLATTGAQALLQIGEVLGSDWQEPGELVAAVKAARGPVSMSSQAQIAAARQTERLLKASEASERAAIEDLETALPDARRWRELVRMFGEKNLHISAPDQVNGILACFVDDTNKLEALLWEVTRAIDDKRDRSKWKPEDALVDVLEAHPLPEGAEQPARPDQRWPGCTLEVCALCGTDPDYPPKPDGDPSP